MRIISGYFTVHFGFSAKINLNAICAISHMEQNNSVKNILQY